MSQFDRQELIEGWDQRKLQASCIAINGRGWTGTFLTWACCSMGIGQVIWIGSPRKETQRFADWFLSEQCPFPNSTLVELPFDAQYDEGLEWGISQSGVAPLVCVNTNNDADAKCVLDRVFAQRNGAVLLEGSAGNSGLVSVGNGTLDHRQIDLPDDPAIAMAVAALLSDEARSTICPLPSDIPFEGGALGWSQVPRNERVMRNAMLIGCGGIGCWAATLLALYGHKLFIHDSDHVELSNLPRQGLFSVDDAVERRNKATSVKQRLNELVPGADIVHR